MKYAQTLLIYLHLGHSPPPSQCIQTCWMVPGKQCYEMFSAYYQVTLTLRLTFKHWIGSAWLQLNLSSIHV